MPLKDATPVIDDRNWQQLVDEIRSRIPHYTPEWTDLNDSDPGITLAQVFAHLAEMLLFRMGQVPELAYVKFLELIGIELTPARPARAEISFTVSAEHASATVLVPELTQVTAAGEDGTPLVFETERALTALAARLMALQGHDGAQYRDLSGANAAVPSPAAGAQRGFEPFGSAPRAEGALLLGLGFAEDYPAPAVFEPVSIDIAFWTVPDPGAALVRRCGDDTAQAPARIVWEGFDGAGWVKLATLSDETLAFTRSGHVVVRVPANVQLQRAYLGEYAALDADSGEARPPLFWLRARLAEAQYAAAPRLAAVRLNTVPAIQARTFRDEVLGGTSGERNQSFRFGSAPVLAVGRDGGRESALVIEIDEGLGPQRWQVVSDFLGSGPRDRHVVVNWAAGELFVGDGENGAVPVANAGNPDANVVARWYRSGGGAPGNVGPGAIRVLVTPIDGLDPAGVGNLFAAEGGADEETLDAAKKRARRSLRARERAVTAEDFELLAQEAGQVRRAKALPLAHPQFPGVQVPGAITVIVVPGRGSSEVPELGSAPPLPGSALLRTVCAYLDARRLLGTELFVVAPRYVTLEVRAQVVAEDDADTAALKEAIERRLRTYFDPLLGGDGGDGWPFGGALRYSKVVQQVFGVAGVDSVPGLTLVVDGEERPACTDVSLSAIAPNALVQLTAHEVGVLTRREAGET